MRAKGEKIHAKKKTCTGIRLIPVKEKCKATPGKEENTGRLLKGHDGGKKKTP